MSSPSLFAFDVDDTLEVSNGPVTVSALRELVAQGHIVGLCGNWAVFVRAVADWQRLISFLGPLGISKAQFLVQLRLHVVGGRLRHGRKRPADGARLLARS